MYVCAFSWIQGQRRARIHKLRLEKGAEKAAEELEKCEIIDFFINSYWLLLD